MLRSLEVAANGMMAQQNRVEVISNNLANASTNGFKRILTSLEEVDPQVAQGLRPVGPNGLIPGIVPGLRAETSLDMRPGPLTATGNDLDFAIDGEGLFAIQTPAGIRYTRDGAFRFNSQNQIVNASGYPLLGTGGAIQVPPGSLQVASDGTISVDGEQVAQIGVRRVANPNDLVHEAGNLFALREGAVARAVSDEERSLAQGFLEGSNTNPVQELIAMITAQRIFEAGQRVLTTANDSLGQTINEVGRVG